MLELLFSVIDRLNATEIDPAAAWTATFAFAVTLTFLLARARFSYLSLPQLPPRPAQSQPLDCMVVIPARNEEGFVGRAVKSLPPDSVIVVDDGSTDGTAKEAETAGAGVLHAPVVPRGVFGKPHACMTGARAIATKWILFADADTWYEPGMLESAIHAAEANDLSFVSVHLEQRYEGFAENLIGPYLQALFYTAVDARECPEGAFNGQCILVRRSAYEFIGGFGASLSFLVDDVKLALLADRHRLQFRNARSRLGHARAHRGWRGLRGGIRRNAHRFVLIPSWHALLLLATTAVAALWLPLAVFLLVTGFWYLAAAVAILPVLLFAPWYGLARAILAPLAAYAILPILAGAFFSVLSTTHVEWKGRQV